MTDELLNGLKKRAQVWAAQISRKANAALKPKHIRVSSTSEVKGNKVIIDSTATSPKGDARAYEYGSGIHSTSKKRTKWQQADKTILITPKRKKVLAFPWQKLAGDPPGTWYGGAKLIKKSDEGNAIFRYVNHPGVKPAGGGKGYLRPAIKEVRKIMKEELPRYTGDAYKTTIRKAFTK